MVSCQGQGQEGEELGVVKPVTHINDLQLHLHAMGLTELDNKKVKFTLEEAMKFQRKNRGISPLLLYAAHYLHHALPQLPIDTYPQK